MSCILPILCPKSIPQGIQAIMHKNSIRKVFMDIINLQVKDLPFLLAANFYTLQHNCDCSILCS